jgi:hypothetical protein
MVMRPISDLTSQLFFELLQREGDPAQLRQDLDLGRQRRHRHPFERVTEASDETPVPDDPSSAGAEHVVA